MKLVIEVNLDDPDVDCNAYVMGQVRAMTDHVLGGMPNGLDLREVLNRTNDNRPEALLAEAANSAAGNICTRIKIVREAFDTTHMTKENFSRMALAEVEFDESTGDIKGTRLHNDTKPATDKSEFI